MSAIAEQAQGLRRQANRLLQLGQPREALECLERLLDTDPSDALALTDRGNALQDLQRPAEALISYNRALQVQPNLAAALVNRGNALRSLGRLQEALQDMDAALRIRAAFPEALNNRGNVLSDLGRREEALASFDQALALRGQFPLAHDNRGKLLLDLARPRAALASFEAALRCASDDGEALFGRASALLQLQERLEEAAADYARAAEQGVDPVEALVGRAAALAALQRHDEAATCLTEVLRLSPQREYALGSLMHSLLQTCDWTRLPALSRALESQVRQGQRATHPQSLLSLSDSPELQLHCAQIFAADKYAPNASLGPCAPRSQDRLRVAYVSADFRDHPVAELMIGTLERHDRERFEVIGVSLRESADGPFERRVRAAVDRFIATDEGSRDRDLAAALRELRVDVAVDLMGFTEGLRLGIFAQRAAPVQVSYLGYAGTLGAPYMDYLLADEVVIPRGEERWYSEQVVRLPHCYLPNDDRRAIGPAPTRAAAGLPETGLVFCAFNNVYKINPPLFAVWMRLLGQLPGSVLWLKQMGAQARANLTREAQRCGVAAERLVFAPQLASMAEHLGRHVLADLYLDTLPYNAHSSACDALWAGVPVLTCAGRAFAARVAASALTAVGLAQLITHSLQEYEGLALQLGRQPQELSRLRAQLAVARHGSALFDTARYTRHLESAYAHMHARALRGEPPQSFAIEPQGRVLA